MTECDNTQIFVIQEKPEDSFVITETRKVQMYLRNESGCQKTQVSKWKSQEDYSKLEKD